MGKIKVTIQGHNGIDKSFEMNIGDGDLRLDVDYDDVDHPTVDAMAETVAEIIRNNWDSKLYAKKHREHHQKRWDDDKFLREDYGSFEEYYREVEVETKEEKQSFFGIVERAIRDHCHTEFDKQGEECVVSSLNAVCIAFEDAHNKIQIIGDIKTSEEYKAKAGTNNGRIEIVKIDDEYYVIDLENGDHQNGEMMVYRNGDGTGKLKQWVAPYKFPASGATYKIIAGSRGCLHTIEKRILELAYSKGIELSERDKWLVIIRKMLADEGIEYHYVHEWLEQNGY